LVVRGGQSSRKHRDVALPLARTVRLTRVSPLAIGAPLEIMLDKSLTPDEERRIFDAVLVRALTDGQRCSSCSGLHPDVLDAIDAVAEAWLNEPAPLAANARKVFDDYAGATQ
jgi:hypothetical protein